MRERVSNAKGWLGALAAGTLLSGGCSTMSDSAKGAGIGGAIGTGAGLALGAATGNPRTGAVVGGLLGAGVGAAAGDASDQEKRQKREYQQAVTTAQAQAAQRQIGMIDVVQMAGQGQSDDIIINQIRATGSTFQLSANDLAYLKLNNVSDRVVIEMQNARPQPVAVAAPRRVYVDPGPVYIERPYYYAPPPPVVIGVGGYRRW